MSDANLFEQQRINRRRSAILVVVFILFFAWIGFGGDLAWYLGTLGVEAGHYRHQLPWVGMLVTALAAGMAWYAWRNGPRQVLWATGAWELINAANHHERVLQNVVEEMAVASGLPRPTIWIVPDKDPNAFATGTDLAHSHVAVTEGLLEALRREELQGVIAHEMAHVRNYDVKLMTLLAALVGVIALMSDAAWRIVRFGGWGGRAGGATQRRAGGGKKNPAALIVLVLWLITLLLAPLLSRLMALAVSRNRELLADATAAQFTRNPAALASALRTIENAHEPTVSVGRGSAHLCIADPLGRRLTHKAGFLADLFATHPPMGLRVARLNAMAYKYDKTGVIPEMV